MENLNQCSCTCSNKKVENITIKYFPTNSALDVPKFVNELEYIDGKSDWIDLRASEDVHIRKGEFALIPLGVAMKLPEGYEAIIAPRSSTFKNYGIIQTNSIGIIDNTYCGDNDMWRMPVYATRSIVICANERICQFRIIENQPKIIFNRVDKLEYADRSGFGSTGKE